MRLLNASIEDHDCQSASYLLLLMKNAIIKAENANDKRWPTMKFHYYLLKIQMYQIFKNPSVVSPDETEFKTRSHLKDQSRKFVLKLN